MNSKTIPCPMCGSENEVGAAYCTVCGYHLQQQASNAGGHKCARCGSRVPPGYDFCPVCGLDQRHRFARPATQVVNVSENGSTPSQSGMPQADHTMPAPGLMQGYEGYAQGPPGGAPAPNHPPAAPPPAYPQASPSQYGSPAPQPEPYGAPAQQPFQGGAAPAYAQPGGAYGSPTPPYAPSSGTAQAVPVPGRPDGISGPSMPGAPPIPAPPPANPMPQTGRTEFHDGPPLARPPRVQDEDLTVPVPSRRPTQAPAEGAPPELRLAPIPLVIGRDPLADDDQPPTLPGDRDPTGGGTLPGGPPQGSPPQAWQPSSPRPFGAEGPTAAEAREQDHGPPSPPSLVDPPRPFAPQGAPEFDDAVTGVDSPSATPTRPGASVRLVLVGRDGEEGESFPMPTEAIAVGRERGEILFPEDAFMSPQHARVERSGDVFTLVDLGSVNGVYLKIRGNSAVYPGDLFMVGHQVLRLENVIEPVQEQPPGPDGTRTFGTPLKPAWGKLALVGRGGVAGDTYFLRGAKVIFGREQGDILFPHDPFVSREHARLRLELHGAQMAVFLEDLGSANGTYIRIRGSAEVRGRDTFRIGDQILRLRLDR